METAIIDRRALARPFKAQSGREKKSNMINGLFAFYVRLQNVSRAFVSANLTTFASHLRGPPYLDPPYVPETQKG